MRTTSLFAPLLFAATTLAQGVEEGIAPSAPAPSGCEENAEGNFTIGTLKVGHHKRESAVEVRHDNTILHSFHQTLTKQPQAADSALVCNLKDGILRDRDGRTGSVVANHQFQFDGPPQAGAIYTGGFSICSNGSLAIGGTTVWWQCNSGPFYNLYDEWIGAQCEEIRIQVTFPKKPASSSAAKSSASLAASSSPTGVIASVQSSLATISGAVSTVSKSAVGPSASFSSGAASMTSGSSSTTTGSGSTSPTAGAADAPPAGGAASTTFGVAKGSMLAAFMVIFGGALVL
jgi:hypothetical protein